MGVMKEIWIIRRQKYGPSGCRKPTSLAYWSGKKHSEETKKKRSISNQKWFDDPRNHIQFLEAHHKAHLGKPMPIEVRKKISLAQKGYINLPQNLFKKGHINSEITRKKISESKKGSTSPMKGKHHTPEANESNRLAHLGKRFSDESKKRSSETHKNRLRENPDLVPFKIVARKHSEQGLMGYISERQRRLFNFLKMKYQDAELEYPILTKDSVKYADIGIPSEKIDFEYDSSLHKHFRSEEKDFMRDKELWGMGWLTIRYNDVLLHSLGLIRSGGGL